MACVLEPAIDPHTAELIIQLQIEDASHFLEYSKGKSKESTDEELAFRLQSTELESLSQLLLDKRMALSIATAVQADGYILAESQAQEQTAAKDRDIARRWTENGRPVGDEDPQLTSDPTALDDETLTKLQIVYVSGLEGFSDLKNVQRDDTETEEAESSAFAARRTRRLPLRPRRCVACTEETQFVDVTRAPCGDEYCRGCLERLFIESMKDESLFPPRCCGQPFLMSNARIFLKYDLVQQFEEKRIEFGTPNRTYCYTPTCSAFIPLSHIEGEVATCLQCQSTTCTICKERAHTGDCPDDTALQQLLATAQENGWKRCRKCRQMVELNHGCNHMTCRCGAQFCYNCGYQWKTCTCEQWDEHRLIARANQIIDRDINPPVLPVAAAPAPEIAPQLEEPGPLEIEQPQQDIPQEQSNEEPQPVRQDRVTVEEFLRLHSVPSERAVLVAETVRNLRDNHECRHDRWNYVSGPHSCEECYHRLNKYIFECRQCSLRACNRCRRNRL